MPPVSPMRISYGIRRLLHVRRVASTKHRCVAGSGTSLWRAGLTRHRPSPATALDVLP